MSEQLIEQQMTVAKFGGTSMAQPNLVADIVNNRDDHSVIVVSAPGVDADHSEKMTNQLEVAAAAIKAHDDSTFMAIRDNIIDRFDNLYDSLGNRVRTKLRGAASELFAEAHRGNNPVADTMSIGEELSARYFSERTGIRYVSSDWVRFSPTGRIQRGASVETLSRLLRQVGSTEKVITPGYFGYDDFGRRHLLPRGGSDRSGALAALALADLYGDNAVLYENWTDVDGIYSADPRFVEGTVLLRELTRREVREGAHGGSGVLQGDVIVDLNGSTIPVVVRNTFNLSESGTRVLPQRVIDPGELVTSVSGRGLTTVSIEDLGMADADGYMSRVLTDAANHKLSIEHLPAAQDALMVTLHEEASLDIVEAFADSLRNNALSSDAIVEVSGKAVIYLVSEVLRRPLVKASVLGQAALLLAVVGIGVDADVSHPGSPSLAFLINRDCLDQARQSLHDHFIGSRP